MKKSTIILVVSLVLAMVVGIGSTLAYLTDTDADKNVMTVGRVQIVQNEQQRVEENGVFIGALDPFENNKMLIPVTGRDNTPDTVTVGDWEVTLDDDLNNYIDKIISATNTGNTDAWVRTLVAVPTGAATDDPKEYWNKITSASDNWLHWNAMPDPAEGEQWSWPADQLGLINVDDVVYAVFAFTHHEKVAPGETTYPVVRGLYMDERVDMDVVKGEDGKLVDEYYMMVNGVKQVISDVPDKNGKVNMLVLTQAVQADGFATAEEAFDKAFALGEDEAATLFNWFGGEDGWGDEDIGSPGDKNDTNEPPMFTEHWDGTSDTSWYNDTDTEFVLTTAEQLAGLAELVDGGNNFAGKTVKLGTDICLGCTEECEAGEAKTFDPIGDKSPFAGTFDGDNHTIENIYQSGWDLGYEWGKYGSVALFGELESATVKNLTITGAETQVEGGDVAGITGSATGTCVFENITINDSKIATYNNGCGGIIGWSGAGDYTFKNITIAEDVVLAGLWGSFDSSIGGVVGQGEPGATYNFENVDIACRIDAYNDCTASYDYYNYRMCGMIIGRLAETTTIDGVNYPDTSKYNINCSNVTVTYGDWANYHYCDPTPGYNGGRGMRVEPGYTYDGLPADYDHTQCTTHHNELIPFDQVFGGDQLGVKGLKSYEGVNVVYQ